MQLSMLLCGPLRSILRRRRWAYTQRYSPELFRPGLALWCASASTCLRLCLALTRCFSSFQLHVCTCVNPAVSALLQREHSVSHILAQHVCCPGYFHHAWQLHGVGCVSCSAMLRGDHCRHFVPLKVHLDRLSMLLQSADLS